MLVIGPSCLYQSMCGYAHARGKMNLCRHATGRQQS